MIVVTPRLAIPKAPTIVDKSKNGTAILHLYKALPEITKQVQRLVIEKHRNE